VSEKTKAKAKMRAAASDSTTVILDDAEESFMWMTIEYKHPNASSNDWIALFSPANFNASTYVPEMGDPEYLTPLLVTAPIKYQFSNYSSNGQGWNRFRVINQRYDFVFALFTGGLDDVSGF